MSMCNDKDKGQLLHAYELNLLSQEEKDEFEIHLLNCDYCFNEIKEFSPRGKLMVSSPEIKKALMEDEASKETHGQKIKRYLWPDNLPVLLKPALLLTILIIAVISLSYNNIYERTGMIRSAKVLYLTPERASDSPEIYITENDELILNFIYLDFNPKNTYQLVLTDDQGNIIYSNTNFNDFDNYNSGRLIIPENLLNAETYRLNITTNQPDVQNSEQSYIFTIKK